MEFDFSKITSSKEVPAENQKLVKEDATLSGIVVSIPHHQQSLSESGLPTQDFRIMKWLNKDITECSAKEFWVWCDSVLPGGLSPSDVSYLEKESVRLEMFKKIVTFHRDFSISKKIKPIPTC